MTTHRSFTPEFKAQVVLEVLTGVRSACEACQHYQLKPDLVSKWKAQFLERAATVFATEAQNDPAVARVAELERLLAFFGFWCYSRRVAGYKAPGSRPGLSGADYGSEGRIRCVQKYVGFYVLPRIT